ncbi:MAG: STAS domain-containing protein [Bacteroidales bacterium]|jgi:anti-anti-sigma factor|nr:STAS domain-containing protein [Bacteroidales bacterium]
MFTVDHLENKYIVSFYNVSRLSILNTEEIEQKIIPIIKNPGSHLIINWSGIKFIDSTGFELLLKIYRTSRIHNSTFGFINVSEEIKELFKLVELEHIFEIA